VLFIGVPDSQSVTALLEAPVTALYCFSLKSETLSEVADPRVKHEPTEDFVMLIANAHGKDERGQVFNGQVERAVLNQFKATIIKHRAFVWLHCDAVENGDALVAELDRMDFDGYYFYGYTDSAHEHVGSIWLLGVARSLGVSLGETAKSTGHPSDFFRLEVKSDSVAEVPVAAPETSLVLNG